MSWAYWAPKSTTSTEDEVESIVLTVYGQSAERLRAADGAPAAGGRGGRGGGVSAADRSGRRWARRSRSAAKTGNGARTAAVPCRRARTRRGEVPRRRTPPSPPATDRLGPFALDNELSDK